MSSRILFVLAAISGLFMVAMGAFSAHALSNSLDGKQLEWIRRALEYQAWHTLTMMILAAALLKHKNNWFLLSGFMMAIGILFFSGSLYALAMSVAILWRWITPMGGIFFLIGWLLILIGAFTFQSRITNE